MARKRKNGEGSYGKKKIKGVDYEYYRDANGKYYYGRTMKDLKAKIEKAKDEIEKSNTNREDISFGKYILNWLENVKADEVKRRTYDGYETYVNNMIINYTDYDISGKQMGALSDDMFRRYFSSLSKKYSRAGMQKNYVIINQCLEYALDAELIKKNPLAKVKIPSEDNVAVKKKEVPFLCYNDMDLLYQESKRINVEGFNFGGKIGEPTYGNSAKVIVLIMYSGLRIGECLALKWKDISFENKTITVRNNISTIKNRDKNSDVKYIREETSPKTKAAKRTVSMVERSIEVLQYLKENNTSSNDEDYVCQSNNGSLLNQRNITRTLNNMLVRGGCKVKQCGLHSLRHSYGSYLIYNNVDVAIVSSLLGHSNISTTYNIYVHIIEEQKVKAVDLFNLQSKKED